MVHDLNTFFDQQIYVNIAIAIALAFGDFGDFGALLDESSIIFTSVVKGWCLLLEGFFNILFIFPTFARFLCCRNCPVLGLILLTKKLHFLMLTLAVCLSLLNMVTVTLINELCVDVACWKCAPEHLVKGTG
jgi:hypothetical protein